MDMGKRLRAQGSGLKAHLTHPTYLTYLTHPEESSRSKWS
jgi:hypothetical protein